MSIFKRYKLYKFERIDKHRKLFPFYAKKKEKKGKLCNLCYFQSSFKKKLHITLW